mgnify:CR=1 FL=1
MIVTNFRKWLPQFIIKKTNLYLQMTVMNNNFKSNNIFSKFFMLLFRKRNDCKEQLKPR